jgi:hypothetical protein
MKKDERYIYFYDLIIEASSRKFGSPIPITVARALELIEQVPIEHRRRSISSNKAELYVSDWHRDTKTNTISILINRCDRQIPDPTFSDPETKSRRIVRKIDNEGQDFSAHLVIKLNTIDSNASATLLIEHCSGLNVTVVKRLLDKTLALAKTYSPEDFKQKHPNGVFDKNGNSDTYNVKFTWRIDGHPSKELISDLNSGKLQWIDLITEKEEQTPFDGMPYINEKRKTVHLTVTEESNPSKNNWNKLKDLFLRQKDNFATARISFKTKSGIPRTVDLDTISAGSELYVKRERITGFKTSLESSYEKINIDIATKMKFFV